MNFLQTMLVAALGFNLVMFIPAFIYKTDKLTDASYSLTFIFLALIGYLHSARTPMHLLVFFAVVMWALRLGGFLLFRVWNVGRDKRFDDMREDFFKFIRFWLLQGLSVFIILCAAFLLWNTNDTKLNILGGIGFILESIADWQKWIFKKNPKNKNKWIEDGVWGISRHPNYLGEMMVWIGVYMMCYPTLIGQHKWWALISPVYIIVLLLFISGIPMLEKSADARWGKDKAYKAYKQRVPVLLPIITKD
jgi:steroid 5-alpha reductase family enzyme